jgi:hypothetical protein
MIAPTELTQNHELLNAQYDPNQPIETLFQQVQDARAFAVAGGQPYGAAMIVNMAYTLVFNTGLFHRRNAAERAIKSFKYHLISGLCSTDKSFPMHLRDRLLPQAVITLNMLRTSIINPKLSASTHIDGQYYFNRALLVPPGMRIIAHETPSRRRTWAPHGKDGWYIGPALEHY